MQAGDTSTSINSEEGYMQHAGYVATQHHVNFLLTIESGWHGCIAEASFEWAVDVLRTSVVPW